MERGPPHRGSGLDADRDPNGRRRGGGATPSHADADGTNHPIRHWQRMEGDRHWLGCRGNGPRNVQCFTSSMGHHMRRWRVVIKSKGKITRRVRTKILRPTLDDSDLQRDRRVPSGAIQVGALPPSSDTTSRLRQSSVTGEAVPSAPEHLPRNSPTALAHCPSRKS